MQTLLLALGLALAAAPAEPELRAGFSPHPALVDLSVAVGASSMRSLGYSSCSSAPTSDGPAFAFTLPEMMTDLRLVIDAPAVLVQPDGTFVCVKEPVWLKEWSPGRYQVLLYGDGPTLKAKLRLEQPERSTFEIKAALAAMPEVVLSGASAQNPVFHTLAPKAVFHARSSGIGCGPETLAPLAKVKVLHGSTWSFAVKDGATVLLNPASGGCRTDLASVRLEPGEYVLWSAPASAEAEQRPLEIAVMDQGRPLMLAKAPVIDLGDLKKPVALIGESVLRGWFPAGWGACPNLPQMPSLYVKGADKLKNVEVRLWRDGGLGDKARFHFFGPLEDPRAGRAMRCDLVKPTFRELRGTWAVFVTGGEKETAKKPFVALAYRVDLPIDPAAAPVPIPENLPPADRALSRHFPWYREEVDLRHFFLEAPQQIFVSADDGDGPLVVVGTRESERGRFLEVMHYLEGSDMVREERARLAPGAPKGPMVPKKIAPYDTLQAALLKAGPADEPLVARYRAVEAEVNACVSAFLIKGDPEWAKSEELISLSDGSGTRDPRFVIADETCRANRIEAAGKALLQQMNKSRDAGAAAYVAALKRRFK